MDIAKYAQDLEDLIARLPGFIRDQQDELRSSGSDAGRAERSLKFSRDLKAMNNNPFVSGLFPFVIFGQDGEESLTEAQIEGLLDDARSYGVSDHVMIVHRHQHSLVVFDYAAEPYMRPSAELRGLVFTNMDGEGLVMKDLVLLGLFSAPELTLRSYAKDAEKFISARQGQNQIQG